MEFPKLTDNLSIISALGDNPGTDDGLSAEELKAKFDQAALILQRYLNGTLVEKLNEIFAAGPGVPSNGFNMNGPINMNGQPLWNVRNPVGDGDALNLQFANANYAPKNHVENNNNPHGVTAEQVGARPDTWFPTIAEIGAAPVINIGNYTGDIDDVNALPVNSVGWVLTNTVNNPRTSYGIIETWGSTNTIRNQRITYTDGGMCQRMRFNSKWTDWEWVNPSMSAGTAYLTSETWNGKAVYAKLINLGTLPSNALLTNVDTGILNGDNPTIVSFDAYITDGTFIYNTNQSDDLDVYLWSNGSKWVINIKPNRDGYNQFTGKAVVKWVYN